MSWRCSVVHKQHCRKPSETMLSLYLKPSINHGSWADKFSSTWTFFLLLVLASIASLRHYLGPNVACHLPSHFTTSHMSYAAECCWMARKIHSSKHHRQPPGLVDVSLISKSTLDDNKENTRTLYQWLPIILVFQALLFRFPDVVLRVSESTFGFGCQKIIGMVKLYTSHTSKERVIIAKDIGAYMYETISRRPLNVIPFGILTVILAIVKLLYFANAVTQLIILQGFLSPPNVTSYGQYVMESIINKNYSYIGYSPAFPRDILCDYQVRVISSLHRYTVPCVVPANEFNEKMCFIVWMWILFVCVASGTSGLVFLLKSLLPMARQSYVRKYLSMAKVKAYSPEVNKFSGKIISQDGLFVLKMVGDISSDILVRDIVVYLWNEYNSALLQTSTSPLSVQATTMDGNSTQGYAVSPGGASGQIKASAREKTMIK